MVAKLKSTMVANEYVESPSLQQQAHTLPMTRDGAEDEGAAEGNDDGEEAGGPDAGDAGLQSSAPETKKNAGGMCADAAISRPLASCVRWGGAQARAQRDWID